MLVLAQPGGGWHIVEHAPPRLPVHALAVGGEHDLEGPAVVRQGWPPDQASLFKTVHDRGDPRGPAVKARGELAHEHGPAGLEVLQGMRLHRGDREPGSAGLEAKAV